MKKEITFASKKIFTKTEESRANDDLEFYSYELTKEHQDNIDQEQKAKDAVVAAALKMESIAKCRREFKAYLKKAQQGDPDGMFNAGCYLIWEADILSDLNPVDSINWIKQAADKGHAGAMLWLARNCVEKNNWVEASKWYGRAAKQTGQYALSAESHAEALQDIKRCNKNAYEVRYAGTFQKIYTGIFFMFMGSVLHFLLKLILIDFAPVLLAGLWIIIMVMGAIFIFPALFLKRFYAVIIIAFICCGNAYLNRDVLSVYIQAVSEIVALKKPSAEKEIVTVKTNVPLWSYK